MARTPDNGVERGNGHTSRAHQRVDFSAFARILSPGVIAQRVRHDVSSGVSIIRHIISESSPNGHESLSDLRAKFFYEDQDPRGRAELALQIIQMSINDPKKLDRVARHLDLAVVAMGGDYVQPRSQAKFSGENGNGHKPAVVQFYSDRREYASAPIDDDWNELDREEPVVRAAIVAGWQDLEAAKT